MARIALDESSFAENELEDGGSAASWAMMHPNSRSGNQHSNDPSASPQKSLFVGSLAPPPPADMAGEAVMPPSQLGESEESQQGDYVLRVELRNFDGSFPTFPPEMLSMTHPLSDVEAHCRRERENFKRQYLRAVKKFRRRRAKIQHEKMLEQMRAQVQAQQQNTPLPSDVSNSGHVPLGTPTQVTKDLLNTAFRTPSPDTGNQSGPETGTGTGADVHGNSTAVALGGDVFLQPPCPAFSSDLDLHAAAQTETLLVTIMAEIRLAVRRSLVAQLRARRAKVKRAQFHAIVEETSDTVFVQWQKEKDALLRVSIRHYLQSSNCKLHRNIDTQLSVLFDCPKP